MSPKEIVYRTKKVIYIQAQTLEFFLAMKIPPPQFSHKGNQFIGGKPQGIASEQYCKDADKILEGKIAIFGLNNIDYGEEPSWNRDPLTGTTAPLMFGKKLDYRNVSLVGNIKYLWEPNRHHHLVTLAQAYHLTNNPRYLNGIEKQLSSWFEQCPYLLGANWASSLELGIRLINWSIVWQLIGGETSSLFSGSKGTQFLNQWLESIYRHVHFIRGHFSRYSSANNHLIGEAAGLYIATVTWPFWKKFASWRCLGRGILEKEAIFQNNSDGVNKEQAVSYQQFVLDFLIIAGLAGKYNNEEFSKAYWTRIELMLEYLASIMDVSGNVPMVGDADDGFVTRLSTNEQWCPYRSLLTTGAILFNRHDFKIKGNKLDTKTLWLIGDKSVQEYKMIPQKPVSLPIHREFPEGGYYILGCCFESKNEIRMVVDAGPTGYLSIAAHGHADALAINLSVAGLEFLIDPGTYAYHTEKKWRDYFRGTSAHNTIRIDGQDQSASGGNFMWLHQANAWCEVWQPNEDVDRFVGVHDGYTRLHDPVIHRREIRFYKAERKIIVEDTIFCKESHSIECFWHFSEYCSVKIDGKVVKATNQGRNILLTIKGRESIIDLLKGDTIRPAGWVSRRFHVKQPSATIVRKDLIKGDTKLITEIFVN